MLIETATLGRQFLKCDFLVSKNPLETESGCFFNTSSMSVVISVFAQLKSYDFAGQGFLLKLPFRLKITA